MQLDVGLKDRDLLFLRALRSSADKKDFKEVVCPRPALALGTACIRAAHS
jgi:hypothetical protein